MIDKGSLFILVDNIDDYKGVLKVLEQKFNINKGITAVSANNYGLDYSHSIEYRAKINSAKFNTRRSFRTDGTSVSFFLFGWKGALFGGPLGYILGLFIDLILPNVVTLAPIIIAILGAMIGAVYTGLIKNGKINPKIQRYRSAIMKGSYLIIISDIHHNQIEQISNKLKTNYQRAVIDSHHYF